MKPSPPQIIRLDEVYGQTEFRERTGLVGQWAWRQVRREGLLVVRIGNLRFVHGGDWIDFINRAAEENGNKTGDGPLA